MKRVILLLALLSIVFAQTDLSEEARAGMTPVFDQFQGTLSSVGFEPLTASPGSEEFQQFVAAALLVYLFVGEALPLKGIMRLILTLFAVGLLGSWVVFDWFAFVLAFAPSLFIYYVMNDLLDFTLLTSNTRKLISIFSMFVVYFFMDQFLIDIWQRVAIFVQMGGWTLLVVVLFGMLFLRIFAYFLKGAQKKVLDDIEP